MVMTLPGGEVLLVPRHAARRARALKLVLTDCDGVLTDGGVFYSADGETLKRFSMRDGMGVERLREVGIATAIITRERSAVVARRSQKLGLPFLFEGMADKRAGLPRILEESGLEPGELAFIGDDVNDVGLLLEVGRAGLTAAPADAAPEARAAVHYHCRVNGGYGAFREFAEWILSLRAGSGEPGTEAEDER
jgi:3-deoxy-D-manno-octulosonate 8-phosphate phosphatase (KDO 8-P phosphatase)